MTVDVKICGIRTAQMLEVAVEAGATYVGLVMFPQSPRNVSLDSAAKLAIAVRGRAKTVVLLVDPDDEMLGLVANRIRPDFIQLHGNEPPERVRAVGNLTKLPVIKAIKVAGPDDLANLQKYENVSELLLFDAKAPSTTAHALPGGNGVSFDWNLLKAAQTNKPYMLSGGLDPSNVAAAIELTGAKTVDVSSGVETSPGVKDAALIKTFIQNARSANLDKAKNEEQANGR